MKGNAVAGRAFESFAALEAHLEQWTREIADRRVHGTTGEEPGLRFERDEAKALKPSPGRGAFLATRDLSRRVGPDCAVESDTNAYSVPRRLIGERVRVLVTAETVRVTHAGIEVARHRRSAGRRGRIVGPVPSVAGHLDQHAPGGRVARLRHTALTPGSATRILRGNQATRYAMSWRGLVKRVMSPNSAITVAAATRANPRSDCSA